jgi:hypothetical protein
MTAPAIGTRERSPGDTPAPAAAATEELPALPQTGTAPRGPWGAGVAVAALAAGIALALLRRRRSPQA